MDGISLNEFENGNAQSSNPNIGLHDHTTVVLVGRTGNGKCATGNSILGKKSFVSKARSSGVTITTQLHQTQFPDGSFLNVIDTPGLFDCSLEHDFIGKEIVKCFETAYAGFHAILVVLSVRFRFSKEEEAVINNLKDLFGEKIFDYMIVVFTGGDVFDNDGDDESSLDDYLGADCPESLREILGRCENRKVLFDNKTKDEKKQFEQRHHLFALVKNVFDLNGGRPYTNEDLQIARKKVESELIKSNVNSISLEKEEIFQAQEDLKKSLEEQLKQATQMVESKAMEINMMLKWQVAEEKKARLKVEEETKAFQNELKKKNDELRWRLEMERHNAELARNRNQCAIL